MKEKQQYDNDLNKRLYDVNSIAIICNKYEHGSWIADSSLKLICAASITVIIPNDKAVFLASLT